jgi:integrase
MTVYRRGLIWYYDFRLDGRRYTARVGPTKGAAKHAESLARSQALAGRLQQEWGLQPRRGRTLTVRAFFELEYEVEARNNLAPEGFRGARGFLRRFVARHGALSLAEVTPQVLESFKTERLATVTANTLKTDFRRLKRFFGLAVTRGYLTRNPARGIKLPVVLPRHYSLLEESQERAFFGAIADPVAQAALRFMCYAGLRIGEICQLRWGDIDLGRRRLSLVQNKTAWRRTTPLVAEAIAILRAQRGPYDADQPVFRNRAGRAYARNTLWDHFDQARRACGIKGVRPHDLRHTIATRLAERGEDVATIGALLGHKPPYTTTLIYLQHTSEKRQRQALERLFPQNSQPPGSAN